MCVSFTTGAYCCTIMSSLCKKDFWNKFLAEVRQVMGNRKATNCRFLLEIRFVSQEQFAYINNIFLKHHNAQLSMNNFEDLMGFLIHSPHAKLKFTINKNKNYQTPHFEGRISILDIILMITNEKHTFD